ncbi:FAD-dependent oxidoreductase [Microbacterium elymi]|uniref:FAD-dependent oxidoreductase n=1 Tax=Microbacterium elymi TaxID=2909587 RepID=UPI00338E9C9D
MVIGGGYVGLEFAAMFTHFGSSVTVLDRGPRPLEREDADVAATAAQILADDGVHIVSGAQVTAIADGAAHARVTYEDADGERSIEADAVLLAVGRTPVTAGLGLDRAGVDVDDRGFVRVDSRLAHLGRERVRGRGRHRRSAVHVRLAG